MRYLLILTIALAFNTTQGQNALLIDWKKLSELSFEDKYFTELEAWYIQPVFPKEIKKLDGKRVLIKGYVIPIDIEANTYALSAYPFSACFFCGGAGPETVMTLNWKSEPDEYSTDDVIQVMGILKLNSESLDEFAYILNDVEEVK